MGSRGIAQDRVMFMFMLLTPFGGRAAPVFISFAFILFCVVCLLPSAGGRLLFLFVFVCMFMLCCLSTPFGRRADPVFCVVFVFVFELFGCSPWQEGGSCFCVVFVGLCLFTPFGRRAESGFSMLCFLILSPLQEGGSCCSCLCCSCLCCSFVLFVF